MATPIKPAKTSMSSRLLTMKFMQRAAASSPTSSDTTAEPPSKRLKTSSIFSLDDNRANIKAMQAAVAAEEMKRTQALDQQAAEAGDIKWILEIASPVDGQHKMGLDVVEAGYSAIDAVRNPFKRRAEAEAEEKAADEDENEEEEEKFSAQNLQRSGRKNFGSFGVKTEFKQKEVEDTGSSDSDNKGSGSSEDDGAGDPHDTRHSKGRGSSEAAQELRAKREARHQARHAAAIGLAEKRRSKEVKLNKLSSISSGGGASKGRTSMSSDGMTCFTCGGKGHRKKDCPKAKGARYST